MNACVTSQSPSCSTSRRVWPNLIRKFRGLPVEISYVDGIWAGDFLRGDVENVDWPELFLYSNRDYYLPAQFIEAAIAARKQHASHSISAVNFKGSGHVAHLRKHKKAYHEAVLNFMDEGYFRRLRE